MSKILSIAVIVLLLLVAVNKLRPRHPGAHSYQKISASEAQALMKEKTPVILDVRTPAEFHSGHIAGAINIPNESIQTSRPSQLADLDATILVYCRSGARSARASAKLASMGYTDVNDFGGILSWDGDLVR